MRVRVSVGRKEFGMTAIISGLLPLLLLMSSAEARSPKDRPPASEEVRREEAPPAHPETKRETVRDATGKTFQRIFEGIDVQTRLGDEFEKVYNQHRREITRIIHDNPGLLWDTIDLSMDVLPALRTVGENDGKLLLSREVYSRAEGLYDQCEALASPDLARDLRKARKLVELRTTQLSPDRVQVDLRE